jgi:hypothetical protein
MKKIFLFVAVASAFSLASCKKDRTCTCTTTGNSGGVAASFTTVSTLNKVKKGDAKKACISNTYVSSGETITTTCTLK